jgi:hypothetical protein
MAALKEGIPDFVEQVRVEQLWPCHLPPSDAACTLRCIVSGLALCCFFAWHKYKKYVRQVLIHEKALL